MKELLEAFSIEQIILFIVLLAFAIKEGVTFFDWARDRIKQSFNKENNQTSLATQISEMSTELKEDIQTLQKSVEENSAAQEDMRKTIGVLVDSDKDDIKAWITEKHHYFCYEKGYIDDYNLDCMERRFKHYQDENGNSFAEDLMNEVRALPKISQSTNNTKH